MDRAGIDLQVLSAAPQLPYGSDADRAVAAARYVNDEYAAVVSVHRDRFRAFAATPMPHIDAVIAEIARALDELGMVGVVMNTSVLDRAITDPDFEPIFAELDARGAVLYLHPVGNGACSPLVTEHRLTWMAGAPFEDTIAALQLITSDHPQGRRSPGVGGTRYAGGPKPGGAPIVVRHRQPLSWTRIALRHRNFRGGPDTARHRLPLRGRRYVRACGRVRDGRRRPRRSARDPRCERHGAAAPRLGAFLTAILRRSHRG